MPIDVYVLHPCREINRADRTLEWNPSQIALVAWLCGVWCHLTGLSCLVAERLATHLQFLLTNGIIFSHHWLVTEHPKL